MHNPQLGGSLKAASWGFSSTFKTLTRIQSKQVGSLVGALVADAACRPLDRVHDQQFLNELRFRPSTVTAAYESISRSTKSRMPKSTLAPTNLETGPSKLLAHSSTSETTPQQEPDPLVFYPEWHSPVPATGPLKVHSFSGEALNGVLQAMADRRGHLLTEDAVRVRLGGLRAAFPDEYKRALLPKAPGTSSGRLSRGGRQFLSLFPLCAVAALPCAYPYCDDAALREYSDVLLQFIGAMDPVTLPSSDRSANSSQQQEEQQRLYLNPVVSSATPYAHSFLSVIMRYLQDNPNPVKNSAFRAVVGTSTMFPSSYRGYCPTSEGNENEKSNEDSEVFAAELRRVIEIVDVAKSYAHGVELCITEADPTNLHAEITSTPKDFSACERAILVGACLGAKFGAREIPPEWIDATEDYAAICSSAMEVAQWAWNPAK